MSTLPKLNELGFLPAGTHVASVSQIGRRFGTTSESRNKLWKGFLTLLERIKQTDAFQAIEIGGSFVTNAEAPSDIDVALELKPATELSSSAMALLNDDEIKSIKEELKVQIVVKRMNSAPLASKFNLSRGFVSDNVILFRVLKKQDLPRISQRLKRAVYYDEDFRGVIRIEL